MFKRRSSTDQPKSVSFAEDSKAGHIIVEEETKKSGVLVEPSGPTDLQSLLLSGAETDAENSIKAAASSLTVLRDIIDHCHILVRENKFLKSVLAQHQALVDSNERMQSELEDLRTVSAEVEQLRAQLKKSESELRTSQAETRQAIERCSQVEAESHQLRLKLVDAKGDSSARNTSIEAGSVSPAHLSSTSTSASTSSSSLFSSIFTSSSSLTSRISLPEGRLLQIDESSLSLSRDANFADFCQLSLSLQTKLPVVVTVLYAANKGANGWKTSKPQSQPLPVVLQPRLTGPVLFQTDAADVLDLSLFRQAELTEVSHDYAPILVHVETVPSTSSEHQSVTLLACLSFHEKACQVVLSSTLIDTPLSLSDPVPATKALPDVVVTSVPDLVRLEALSLLSRVIALDLTAHRVSERFFAALLKRLPLCPNLTLMRLDGSSVSRKGEEQLNAVLARCPRLQSIEILTDDVEKLQEVEEAVVVEVIEPTISSPSIPAPILTPPPSTQTNLSPSSSSTTHILPHPPVLSAPHTAASPVHVEGEQIEKTDSKTLISKLKSFNFF